MKPPPLTIAPETPTNRAGTRLMYLTFILVGAFLVIRSFDSHRLSEWAFGDAQTLMAAKVYANEGFRKVHFLWVPQGYTHVSHWIDSEPLRHHAHGSSGEPSGLGPKRIYTHWPSWYAVAYGVLAKLGIENKSIYQVYAICLSLMGVLFLFLFCRRITDDLTAFFIAFFYLAAPAFWQYSDSLATMPYDDFFRFAFLYAWAALAQTRTRVLLCSLLYLCATLTSLDSLLFIPLAAVSYDVLFRREYHLGTWLLLGLPALAGFAIQFAQNSSYLGLEGAWADWKGYFFTYSHSENTLTRYDTFKDLLQRAFHVKGDRPFLFLFTFVAMSLRSRPKLILLALLLMIAGSGLPMLISSKMVMQYETRQLLPVMAVTFSGIVAGLLSITPHFRFGVAAATLGLFAALLYGYNETYFKRVMDYPSRGRVSAQTEKLLRSVVAQVPEERVYFQVGKHLNTWPYTKVGYEQIDPVVEYYSQGLFLTVPSTQVVAQELSYLWQRREKPFHPIVLLEKTSPNPVPPFLAELRAQRLFLEARTLWEKEDVLVVELFEQDRSALIHRN